MAIAVKDTTVIAVEIEDTEGVYKAPTAGTSYVQTLSDGTELTPAKELLERNVFNGSIGKTTPLTGTRTVSGTLPTETRASDVEGAAPEVDTLMQSALGTRKQGVSATTKTGNTASQLEIEDADIAQYSVGDIVLVKEAGAYHVSPIVAVDSTPTLANIQLLVPAGSAFSDNVEVSAFTTYSTADTGHPSLSVSKYVQGAVLEQAVGCRVNTLSLENFTTGQLASWSFGFEGLNFSRSITPSPFIPVYDTSRPPIILEACVYQDGVLVDVNELSFSVENTLGFVTSTCSTNGRISGRSTERTVSGSFNPYKSDDNIDQYNKFDTTSEYSLFAFAKVPTGVSGEYNQVVAVYIPNCITTELGESDQDGLLQEDVSFSAGRGQSGTEEEIYICFI
jgi:hypothetical protein